MTSSLGSQTTKEIGGLCNLYLLNMIDDFNRIALAIEVELSLPAIRLVRTLEHSIEWKSKPSLIRCDNGPEYTDHTLIEWPKTQDIRFNFIQSGMSTPPKMRQL